MATRIDKRAERLRQRKTDPETGRVILGSASARRYDEGVSIGGLGGPPLDSVLEYLLESAAPVDKAYTDKTYEECRRIQNQVNTALGRVSIAVDFDHQGSVTNDTHIKLHSDIDLLVLPTTFVHLKAPLVVTDRYRGSPIDELATIRRVCEECLTAEFPAADVDTNGGKCVSICGGSLRRKVDVVPASWVHTHAYETNRSVSEAYAKRFKGINVFDKPRGWLIENFPFLHNARIEEKDAATQGNLRRLIRLVKSIRSDADEAIGVSSYHIAGLCYAMPHERFSHDIKAMLMGFVVFAWDLVQNPVRREALLVPNATELLFANIDVAQLSKLLLEAWDLVYEKAA
jgi:hypothetical protein